MKNAVDPAIERDASVRVIWIGIGVLAAVYVCLFVAGIRFFVYKTAILPVILAYGLLVRQRVAFVIDWLPILSATVLFDAVRGAIWVAIVRGYQSYSIEYVVRLEHAVFGVPALSIPFQLLRRPALDGAAVMVHASHFAFFLLFGLVLWHARREHFQVFGRALILLMLFGLIGYALIPTAPPWMAAEPNFRAIPPVTHITRAIYTRYAQELYGSVDTNPVAAMPSLHAAFPVLCALIGWRAYRRRIATALSVYALIVMFVVVYLGEHYAVDAIAGALVAVLAIVVASRMPRTSLSPRATVLASATAGALTVAIAFW